MKRLACLAFMVLAGCNPVARQDAVAAAQARADNAYNVAEDAAARVHNLEDSNRRLWQQVEELRRQNVESAQILADKERQINELARAYDAHLDNHRAGILR